MRTWIGKNRSAGEASLRGSIQRLKSGIVSESLGLLEAFGNDHRAALEAFEQARALYAESEDRTRVAIHEANSIAVTKGPDAAAQFLKGRAADTSAEEGAALLNILARIYGGSDGTPTPAKKEPAKKR